MSEKCTHIDETSIKLTTVYKKPDDIKCTQCKENITNEEFKRVVEIVSKQYEENLKKQRAEEKKKYV